MSTHTRRRSLPAVLAVAAALTSCDTFGIESDNLRLAISPRSLTLALGDTARVTFSVLGGTGGLTQSRLESPSPAIAGIVAPDRVVGVGAGSTFVILVAWDDRGAYGRDSIRVHVQ